MATEIKINGTQTDVRGGGFGNQAWIARITGTDPKFGMAREFCQKDTSGLSGSRKSGLITFDVTEPGVYEFRGFCVGSTSRNWEWSGFVNIHADGTVEEISKAQALELARQMVTA